MTKRSGPIGRGPRNLRAQSTSQHGDDMSKTGNHVSNQPKVPAPPKGNDHLTPGRQPNQSAAPPARVHREPHQNMVKVRDSDQDGN